MRQADREVLAVGIAGLDDAAEMLPAGYPHAASTPADARAQATVAIRGIPQTAALE